MGGEGEEEQKVREVYVSDECVSDSIQVLCTKVRQITVLQRDHVRSDKSPSPRGKVAEVSILPVGGYLRVHRILSW